MSEVPRYIANGCWSRVKPKTFKQGDYVVATKYHDGDPGDQFCIGFYDRSFEHAGGTRHLVVNSNGAQFRHNGFRRVERVSHRRGAWLVNNIALIERLKDRFSVWHWYRASWLDLEIASQRPPRETPPASEDAPAPEGTT